MLLYFTGNHAFLICYCVQVSGCVIKPVILILIGLISKYSKKTYKSRVCSNLMIFWGVYFDLHTKVLAVYRYVQILPVFDMFEVKIGGVQQKN